MKRLTWIVAIIALIALVLAVEFVLAQDKRVRYVTVDGEQYAVEYAFNEDSLVSVPATLYGQAHYPATIEVFHINSETHTRSPVGSPFSGQWTPKGCFEDDPAYLVSVAVKAQQESYPDDVARVLLLGGRFDAKLDKIEIVMDVPQPGVYKLRVERFPTKVVLSVTDQSTGKVVWTGKLEREK